MQNELRDGASSFSVVIDQTSGKTPRGRRYQVNLTRHHALLRKHGCKLIDGFTFDDMRGQRFVDSAASDLVQVADVVAYNVLRQFRDYGAEWEQHLHKLPMYDHFRKISGKFRQADDGTVDGYGIVKFPVRTRVRWRVNRD